MSLITIGYTGSIDGYNNMNIAKVNNKDVVASSGIITSVAVGIYQYQSVPNCSVGIFYGTYSDITCRDYINLGTLSNSNPITGLELDCVAGDMIGQESGGGGAVNIYTQSRATADTWYVGAGSLMGCTNLAMTNTMNSVQYLYGEGNTVSSPTVTTQAVSDIGVNTATGNGNVTNDGGGTITERGVCISTSENPTTADTCFTSVGTTGAFTASMTSLIADTLYYVRAYAINPFGTSYGEQVSFSTLASSYLLNANLFAETGYVAIQRKNLKIPTWENDGVPISPVKGDVGYNIETGVYNIYDGTDWIEYDSNLMHDALTLGVIGSTPNTNGSTITDQVLNLEPASETYGGVVSTAEQSFSGLKKLQGGLQIGSGNDHADFSNKGFPTLAGDAQGKLTLRPNLVQSRTKISSNKPTEVDRGCNVGYSFPIYNSDDEELFFRMRIPARWDGTTDPQFGIMCTITGTESVGNKFKFQLEWQTTHCGGTTIMGTTVSSCVSEQTIITSGGVAHTAYCVFFSLDADDANNPIIAGRMLQGRLRRITASANEVSNEIAVWDWAAMWRTSKVFGVYSVESNVS